MKPSWSTVDSDIRLFQGDCMDVLKSMPDGSFDACVTDPPYALTGASRNGSARVNDPEKPFGRHNLQPKGFMGKAWDGNLPGVEHWREVLRVLKPGAHLLAFGGTRTHHRLMCAIEDAGFEIRDCVMWIYGSGFPKSLDVSKAIDKEAGEERERIRGVRSGVVKETYAQDAWSKEFKDSVLSTEPITAAAAAAGWGTALKPAWEPIVVARKPLVGTVAANFQEHGTGALNIDGCRVPCDEPEVDRQGEPSANADYGDKGATDFTAKPGKRRGRPLRIIDPKPEANGAVYAGRREAGTGFDGGSKAAGETTLGRWPANVIHDGSDEVLGAFPASKSCNSPSSARCEGEIFGGSRTQGAIYPGEDGTAARFFYTAKASSSERGEENKHPTVKPLALMRYLCRLVTSPGGLILDPFAGSGTTALAAREEWFRCVLIEREAEYVDIAVKRFKAELNRAPLFNTESSA